MKLVFYSGGHAHENESLDLALLHLTKKKKPKISFIPFSSFYADEDYKEFVERFQKYNLSQILLFPVDVRFSHVLKEAVFSSDIIHLGGGNTFYFLKHLKKSGIFKELKKFVKNGGILTGLSAGAIMMTKTIDMAKIPEFDSDENTDEIKNLLSLGLVPFHFFPHYKNSKRYDLELLNFSKKKNLIYACPDGSGIVINNDEMRFIGRVFCFFEGKKILLSSSR